MKNILKIVYWKKFKKRKSIDKKI